MPNEIKYILIMACDLEGYGEEIGWRTHTRVIKGVSLLKENASAIAYTAATRSERHFAMPCDMAAMMQSAMKKIDSDLKVVALVDDEDWSSCGELRKFFAAIPENESFIIVSGAYHLRRIRLLLWKYHPERLAYARYEIVTHDTLTLFRTFVESLKWVVTLVVPDKNQKLLKKIANRFLPRSAI